MGFGRVIRDKTLVDLVAFAGIMIATNVFTDAVATELDVELLEYMGKWA